MRRTGNGAREWCTKRPAKHRDGAWHPDPGPRAARGGKVGESLQRTGWSRLKARARIPGGAL